MKGSAILEAADDWAYGAGGTGVREHGAATAGGRFEDRGDAADVEGANLRWQRRVMAGLWVILAVLVVLAVALRSPGFRRLVGDGSDRPSATPAWPVNWP
jgi:hypothetical protein